jgi:acyl-CoA dehydrogenase
MEEATMDFSLTPELQDLQRRTRSFIRDRIMPLESDRRQTRHGPTEEFRRELVALGREAGLLAPHVSPEYGGLGLDHVGKAIVFEEAGYSLLGPVAMHIFAPDEGNMHLLEAVATREQKERWLRPLASGETRSCFCMTEPAPGAGSDPSAINTTAVKDGNHWVISGTKWFITGAHGAAFAIIMAKGEDGAATMFLADMDRPGIEIVRTMESLDQAFAGGHAVVKFDNLRVPASDILGEPGKGFRYAQVRLAPARLTHCMRWLGAAQRAHDIATTYAREREVFGAKLVNHEGVGFMLADNEIDIRVSRLAIWHTAWLLDQGARGTTESSIAKVVCSEATWRVVDRCVQVLGGQGVTGETLVERLFREVRAFRIYDGPSEVHRWSLAQRIARHGANW